jgi:hypothetical protein
MKLCWTALFLFAISCAGIDTGGEIQLKLTTRGFDENELTGIYDKGFNKLFYYEVLKSKKTGVEYPKEANYWGELVLGDKNYDFAAAVYDGKCAWFYFDKDRDKNLVNDMVIETDNLSGSSLKRFKITDIPFELAMDNSTLSGKINIGFVPYRSDEYDNLLVQVFSAYTGNICVKGREIEIQWLPGVKPYMETKAAEGNKLCIGKTFVSVSPIKIIGGEVFVDSIVEEMKNCITIKLPEDFNGHIHAVKDENESFITLGAIPENFEAALPLENYNDVFLLSYKVFNNEKYWVRIYVARTVSNDITVGRIEPLRINIVKTLKDDSCIFKAKVATQAGLTAWLEKTRISAKIKIIDNEGKTVASTGPDEDIFFGGKLIWFPPEECKGKNFTAVLELEKIPFEVEIIPLKFSVE